MTVLSKVVLIMVLDFLATAMAFFLGLLFRYDFVYADIHQYFLEGFPTYIGIWSAVTVAVLSLFNLYNCIWVFVGLSEVFRILAAYGILAVIGVAAHIYGVALPRSSCIIGLILSCIFSVGIRFSYRMMKTLQLRVSHMGHGSGVKNVMLIGAGDAGRALATEFQNSTYVRDHLVGVIDDNPV